MPENLRADQAGGDQAGKYPLVLTILLLALCVDIDRVPRSYQAV